MNKKALLTTTFIMFCISASFIIYLFFHCNFTFTIRFVSPNGKQIVMREYWDEKKVFYKNKMVWEYEGPIYPNTRYILFVWGTENEILLFTDKYNNGEPYYYIYDRFTLDD